MLGVRSARGEAASFQSRFPAIPWHRSTETRPALLKWPRETLRNEADSMTSPLENEKQRENHQGATAERQLHEVQDLAKHVDGLR